jgi:hypothetical protein
MSIAGKIHLFLGQLLGPGLDFLQAHHVRRFAKHPFFEALPNAARMPFTFQVVIFVVIVVNYAYLSTGFLWPNEAKRYFMHRRRTGYDRPDSSDPYAPHGFEVDGAPGGEEGLRKVRETP